LQGGEDMECEDWVEKLVRAKHSIVEEYAHMRL
jgi:hypothetical protein